MRTFSVVLSLFLIGLALGLPPAVSFDGMPDGVPSPGPLAPRDRGLPPPANAITRAVPPPASANRDFVRPAPLGPVPPNAVGPAPSLAPFDDLRSGTAALRSGTQALRDGKTDEAVTELEYAARQGLPGAIWKLGRMYADGDGVDKNMLRSFEYFRNLTTAHAYDPPNAPQARFVANAFVALGHFYLDGIPETYVKADPSRARQMYNYAASYFADPDAQFNLARLYLDGAGGQKDPRQAAKWLGLAANKGHYQAQAQLGSMLFSGKEVPRQAAMGLFWLTVAKDSAGPGERWISDTQVSAFAQATEDERALAYRYLENWLRSRRR